MITRRYERLQAERSAAWSEALEVCFKNAASVQQYCQLCQNQGHTARVCRSFKYNQVPLSGNCTSSGRWRYKAVDCKDANIKGIKEVSRNETPLATVARRQGHFAMMVSVLSRKKKRWWKWRARKAWSHDDSTSSSITAVWHNKPVHWNEWALDSGATKQYTPDATGLYECVAASPGSTVEIANDSHEEVKGCGKRDLLVKQPGGIVKTTTLQKVALPIIPHLRHNLFGVKQTAKTSAK